MTTNTEKPHSFKVAIKTAHDREWVLNGVNWRTREQAEAAGNDLFMRWTAVTEWEVQESEQEPNRGLEASHDVSEKTL